MSLQLQTPEVLITVAFINIKAIISQFYTKGSDTTKESLVGIL